MLEVRPHVVACYYIHTYGKVVYDKSKYSKLFKIGARNKLATL
jgi:hypothetical protein